VLKVRLVHKVLKDLRVDKVHKELQVLKVHKEQAKVLKVMLVIQLHKEP